jgi:glucose/mannose-6-phosphate isomerase
MKNLIDALPDHILHAKEIALATNLKSAEREISSLVITGLGGSGIGASIVSEVLSSEVKVPVIVNKDYTLPGFVNANTLVIACSYSGNTEETIAAVKEAQSKGCMIASMSSGGQLAEMAEAGGWNHFIVPGGNPPRSMLGYSLVLLFRYFEHYGLANTGLEAWVDAVSAFLGREAAEMEVEAERISSIINGKIVAVYACDGMGALAERVRQQFNENSKMVGWNAAIPEMNHNELVGWKFEHPEVAVVMLRHNFENPRNAIRAGLNKEILSEKTPHLVEIMAKGNTLIESLFYIIHLTDKLSWYLSEIHKVDIFDIEVIDYLKGKLSTL